MAYWLDMPAICPVDLDWHKVSLIITGSKIADAYAGSDLRSLS